MFKHNALRTQVWSMMNCGNLCKSILVLLKVLLTHLLRLRTPIVQFLHPTTPLDIRSNKLHGNSTTMVSSALVQ
jgi:hypothetical protein